MKKLSDLIKQRREELDIQFIEAKPRTIEEKNWKNAMDFIDNLSLSWQLLYTKILTNNSYAARQSRASGKAGTITQVICKIPNETHFEIELIFDEDDAGNILKAYYVGLNNEASIAYLRYLENDPALSIEK